MTRPTPGMREAIAAAEVGDNVLEKDPTVERLERRVADLLGKEAALFFPSGTMANQVALNLQSRPGTEVVCEAEAHVFHFEQAAAALFSGVQLHRVPSERGHVTGLAYARAIRSGLRYHPLTSLVWVENTHNMHGGVVVPLDSLQAVRTLAEERGLPVHLDGARLWNACVASGVELRDYAACADTVMVSLSKGLGCPVGSLLAGPGELIERGWTVRQRMGGGLRQAGILAAAGLYALDHHLERLSEDHRRARRLADGCREIDGLEAAEPDTNIVMIHLREGLDPAALCGRLEEAGIRILSAGTARLRAVTHLDVDDEGIERAVEALGDALA